MHGSMHGPSSKGESQGLRCACVRPGGGALVERQQLFTVYVHVPPGSELDDPMGLFTPYVIEDRVATSWGSFTLAQVRTGVVRSAGHDMALRHSCGCFSLTKTQDNFC